MHMSRFVQPTFSTEAGTKVKGCAWELLNHKSKEGLTVGIAQ